MLWPDRNSIRMVLVGAVLLLAAVLASSTTRPTEVEAANEPNDPGQHRPVLVELFTSEGCSSCPPADALLARLDAAQPVPGAQVIVLSEHVTYWNSQGWHDPFSFDAMTDRQRRYGERFGLSDVYTPQVVVDGAAEMVGSDERKVTQAIVRATASPKTELTIAEAVVSSGAVHFSVRDGNPSGTVLMAALADDSAQSSVAHGENGGRTLRHVAVVRVLQEMGKGAGDGRTLNLKLPAEIGHEGATPIRLVVFLVDSRSGHVLTAAEQIIRR